MRNMQMPVENACPHDGWYNGNGLLMIENGTFDDYHDRLVEMDLQGKFQKGTMKQWEAMWAAIPLEEKKLRRDKVLKDIEFRPVRTREGKIEMVSTPSDNGSARKTTPQLRKKLKHVQAPGSLANKPDPFAGSFAQQAMSQNLPALPQSMQVPMVGNSIPQAIRPPAHAQSGMANAVVV